jgi:hypothetical protein
VTAFVTGRLICPAKAIAHVLTHILFLYAREEHIDFGKFGGYGILPTQLGSLTKLTLLHLGGRPGDIPDGLNAEGLGGYSGEIPSELGMLMDISKFIYPSSLSFCRDHHNDSLYKCSYRIPKARRKRSLWKDSFANRTASGFASS